MGKEKLKRVPVPQICFRLLVYLNPTLTALFLWLKVNQFVTVKLLLGKKNLESEDRGTTSHTHYPNSPPPALTADHCHLPQLTSVGQDTQPL